MLFRVFLSNSILKHIGAIDGTLTGTTTLDQNEPGSNSNKWVLHTPQIFGKGASLSDAIRFCTQDIHLVCGGGLYSLQGIFCSTNRAIKVLIFIYEYFLIRC